MWTYRSSGNGSIAITSPEGVACGMDGGKTGRAGCINTERRTTELEVVVDATRGEGSVTAGDKVCVDVLARVDLSPIVASHAVKDTNAVALRRR